MTAIPFGPRRLETAGALPGKGMGQLSHFHLPPPSRLAAT
jgi:hypothetical protein